MFVGGVSFFVGIASIIMHSYRWGHGHSGGWGHGRGKGGKNKSAKGKADVEATNWIWKQECDEFGELYLICRQMIKPRYYVHYLVPSAQLF